MRVLFIGTFLSKATGTKSISEKLQFLLMPLGVEVLLVSKKKNQLLRMLNIVIAILFKKYDFAHIDVFSERAFFITEISLKFLSLRKKKVILNLRGGKLPEFYDVDSERIKKAFSRADKLITPSMYLRSFFLNHGFKINYLPNFIDLETFPFKFKRENCHKLLWVRAFTEIYNPNMVVEVMSILKTSYPHLKLTMIGPDKGSLSGVKKMIRIHALEEHIDIAGPVNNNELGSYYHSHSIFLNTTSYESFGVAVLEAAACGIPIVSTSVGELPHLWKHQKDILFIEDKSPLSMAHMITLILNDSEIGATIARNAYQKAKNYSWDKVGSEWILLFSQVNG